MTPIPEPTPRRDRNVSPAVKGTVQFTFDVLELFLDARYDTALIGLDTARQIVKQTSVLKTGLDLVGLAIDRQYAFERDVLVRARRAVDPNDVSFAGAGLIRRPSSAAGADAASAQPHTHSPLRLSAQYGTSQLSVPLHLKNHHSTSERVTLAATPFWSSDGKDVLLHHITFEPASLDVPGESVGTSKVMLEITPEFRAEVEYEAEILVQTTHRTRVPVIVSIFPADISPSPGTNSVSPTASGA